MKKIIEIPIIYIETEDGESLISDQEMHDQLTYEIERLVETK